MDFAVIEGSPAGAYFGVCEDGAAPMRQAKGAKLTRDIRSRLWPGPYIAARGLWVIMDWP
jgi:hypothetical protein